MISRNELKYYSALLKKKFRIQEKRFIAEGEKIVGEGLKGIYPCERIFATHGYYQNSKDYLDKLIKDKNPVSIIKNEEFARLSDTVNSQGIAAVFKIPDSHNLPEKPVSGIIVFLENISDPGNVGTILRNCDWFGIKDVILSRNCAEVFNPKVIRSSMGSLFHLNIITDADPESVSILKNKNYEIITADLKGENIFRFVFPEKAVLIFANEASGPTAEILSITDTVITIPGYGNAESLNVASASAIILSRIKN